MNISPISLNTINKTSSSKKLSFGETPVCKINLKRKQKDDTYKFIPAHFSKLNPSDDKDELLVDRIKDVWGKRNDSYAVDIASNFALQNGRSVNNNFYVISRDDLKDPYRKIPASCKQQALMTEINHSLQ